MSVNILETGGQWRVVGIHPHHDSRDLRGKWTSLSRAEKKAAWWAEHRLAQLPLRSVLIESEDGQRVVLYSWTIDGGVEQHGVCPHRKGGDVK